MFNPGQSKYCSPQCKFFRCQRKALIRRSDRRLCGLTQGDECKPRICQFASCAINKLVIPEGICGLWRERNRRRKVTIDISEIEDESLYKVRGFKDLYT